MSPLLASTRFQGIFLLAGVFLATVAATAPPAVTVAAAGDIACSGTPASGENDEEGSGESCHMRQTAALIQARRPDLVLPLGDEQYEVGSARAFLAGYDKTWGAFKGKTRPAVGNHEYGTGSARGYFGYFGSAAGDPAKGYYSFDRGAWHLIALNSSCDYVGGCARGSAQERWLRADLAARHAPCTLAYWHQPRFSSALHHSDASYSAFWDDLYAARADVVLNGHDHVYERFAPQSPSAAPDPARGIREFIVGTGGRSHYSFKQIEPNSEARNATTFGVLFLRLKANGYDWQFVPERGKTFTDAGSGMCHLGKV
jgi:hypothetical protein